MALVTFGLLAAGAWWSISRFQATLRWVEHTHQVLYELEALLGHAVSAQAASQNYVITGDETSLDDWVAAMHQAGLSLQHLSDLTEDHPGQSQRINQIKPLMAMAAALTRERHELRQHSGPTVALTEARKGELRAVVEQISQVVHATETEERALLDARAGETQTAGYLTLAALLAITLLAIFLKIFAIRQVLRDLAARRKAEAQLDRFFDLTRDLTCIAGFDGYFKRLNPAWEQTLGFSLTELKSKPFMTFLHPEDRASTEAQAARQASGLEVVSFENRYLCQDGSYRWLLWNARPSMEDQLIYATARDITEHKRNEAQIHLLNQELEQRALQLEASNQELEAFSYSVSHDLRAPLRHIDGFAKLLTKHAASSLDAQAVRYITTISNAATKMGQLIDELLTFSRMSRTHLSLVEFDHDALVATVISEAQFPDQPPILWQIDPLPRIRADQAMLQQVWFNYLDNAVKYSRGARAPCIAIGSRIDPAAWEVVFYVRDNGAGFDMQYVAKLFGVFQRLHTEAEFEGTGIGLANVRRIISRHGGRTWAEGRVGGGATFYFSLPLSYLVTGPTSASPN